MSAKNIWNARGKRQDTGFGSKNENAKSTCQSKIIISLGTCKRNIHDGNSYPIWRCNATRNHCTFNHDHLPSLMRLWSFRGPSRHSGSIHSISEPSNYSPDDQVRKTVSWSLQSCAHYHDYRTHEYHLSSSKYISDEYGDDRPQETTDVVGGNCNSLNGTNMIVIRAVLVVDRIYFWELFHLRIVSDGYLSSLFGTDPTSKGQQSSHNTLIISE